MSILPPGSEGGPERNQELPEKKHISKDKRVTHEAVPSAKNEKERRVAKEQISKLDQENQTQQSSKIVFQAKQSSPTEAKSLEQIFKKRTSQKPTSDVQTPTVLSSGEESKPFEPTIVVSQHEHTIDENDDVMSFLFEGFDKEEVKFFTQNKFEKKIKKIQDFEEKNFKEVEKETSFRLEYNGKDIGIYNKKTGDAIFDKKYIGVFAAILKKKGIVPTKIVGVSSDVWNSKIFQERLRKFSNTENRVNKSEKRKETSVKNRRRNLNKKVKNTHKDLGDIKNNKSKKKEKPRILSDKKREEIERDIINKSIKEEESKREKTKKNQLKESKIIKEEEEDFEKRRKLLLREED